MLCIWMNTAYEIGPLAGFELVTVCVVFVGAAVVNLVNVSWLAFAFKIVFSTSSWFIRSISSDIFSFSTSTSSRTANIKCDFTRSCRAKQKRNSLISKMFLNRKSLYVSYLNWIKIEMATMFISRKIESRLIENNESEKNPTKSGLNAKKESMHDV